MCTVYVWEHELVTHMEVRGQSDTLAHSSPLLSGLVAGAQVLLPTEPVQELNFLADFLPSPLPPLSGFQMGSRAGSAAQG